MKVLFDYKIFSRARYGGISRYICELAQHLKDEQVDVTLGALIHTNGFIENVSGEIRKSYEVRKFPRSTNVLDFANKYISIFAYNGIDPDIFHHTQYNIDINTNKSKFVVSTIHDMIHELYPDDFPNNPTARDKHTIFKRSDSVIAISHHTKSDMIDKFGYDPRKISVIHHGIQPLPRGKDEPAFHFPYVLFIGQRQKYKNFSNFLKAFELSSSLRSDFRIVSFGALDFTAEERSMIARLGLEGRVLWASGDDAALENAYRHASCFVYPSKYEGFGMPLLEAMISGCPVACSDASCFPEIAGPAAEYFDPNDPSGLAGAIERVVGSGDRRDALIRSGYERAAEFSWAATAKKTKAVYSQLLSG
jgi:glycosyltransferase involved in cell wall biosynthesis